MIAKLDGSRTFLRRAGVLLCAALLMGCAAEASRTTEPKPREVAKPRPCDDGGSGGFVIDGVCL